MTATFQCRFCQTSFARHEHLSRHIRSHTREKPYRCLECKKSFSRQDVLNRHTSSHVPNVGNARASSSRACIECATGRTRCSRGTPCKRCMERDLACVYPSTAKRKATSVDQNRAAETASPTRSVQQNQVCSEPVKQLQDGLDLTDRLADHDADGSGLERTVSNASAGVVPHVVAWAHGIDSTSIPEDYFTVDNANGFVPGSPLNDQIVGMSTINWLSPHFQDTLNWDNGLAVIPYINEPLPNLSSPFFPSNTPIVNSAWQPGTRFDKPVEEPCLAFAAGKRRNDESEATHRDPASNQSVTGSRTSQSTTGALYVEGAVARAPFRGGLLYQQPTVNYDDVAESPSPHSTPDTHDTTSSGGNLVSNLAYENMYRGIQHEMEMDSSSLDSMFTPLLGHVRRFARLYFEKFHPTYPFLRQSTHFLEQPNSWIVLLAISAVGSKYSGDSRSRSLLDLVDKVLTRRFSSTSPRESDVLWTPGPIEAQKQHAVDIFTIQADILRLLCMLHSGEKQLVERAFTERYRLVEECKRMNLLSRTCPSFDATPTINREDVITAWLGVQSEIRTGMMVWLLDSIIAYEFNCPHLLNLFDLKSPLPCQETIWSHPTAERIIEKGSVTATIVEALELVYIEKRLPSNLSEFATILLIYAVCRQTKEAVYQHQTSLSTWIPNAKVQIRPASQPTAESWPPSLPLLLRWRNSACDCLDLLHWNANGTAARAGGWEHPTILHLHLSRLLLLIPAQHIQRVAATSSSTTWDQDAPDAEYLEACNHIRRWAALDQFKARLAMVHAGALFWHIRLYSSDSFLEPFAAYLATLALWSYSITAQPHLQQTGHGPSLQDSTDQQISPNPMDLTPDNSSEVDEEPEPSFIQLDRPCDDEMVQLYVRLGHKMSGNVLRVGNILNPDAPPKILQEGLRLLSKEKGRASQRRDSTMSMPNPEVSSIWGIRESFTDTLRRLLQAKASQNVSGIS
ncbi:hypothetical protein BGZ63DRAFT_408418 [Mariannaea sp. PMI_226]|nr:hypothetical protein BGZ63DRAFT_408418 [Mariannaea sp. PMI_226]